MSRREIAYLGPAGTYSHWVAERRFGRRAVLIPLPTIRDVCAYVAAAPHRLGVVPIENSSGGALYETVDILLENRPPVRIMEELALEVKLALLGHRGRRMRTLYSHFAPLEHCATWIRRHLPGVQRRAVASTALAAQRAAEDPDAGALGSRLGGHLGHRLVLGGVVGGEGVDGHHRGDPVEADVPNLTLFLVIGGRRRVQPASTRTTLAVQLPNEPGSLCTFLEAFRDAGVNLSRIISRPIRGCPRQYAFLVDIDGTPADARLRRVLARAAKAAVRLRVIGAYPSRPAYRS